MNRSCFHRTWLAGLLTLTLVADALNSEYGESAGSGIRSGKPGPLYAQGNAWLEHNFQRLDYIRRATVIAPTDARK